MRILTHVIFIEHVYRNLNFALFLFGCLLSSMQVLYAQSVFIDQSSRSSIDNTGSNHGVSFGDFNNDGLEDVYVVVRETGIPNKLYLNKGDIVFEEIGELAGVNDTGNSTAATWGDINNDGWLDLYVGNTNTPNILYLNKGDQTFEDITLSAGVGDPFDPRSVQFVDVDNDGFLDIYIHNYNTENVLYKNNQDNTFEDFTFQSGALNIDPAMGTIFFDMDGDGDQDLFALNDGATNVLFENKGGGIFEDISEGSGLDFFCFCMGVDYADYDLDGDYDLYISNYGSNFLMENNGDGTFTDRADEFGLNDSGMGWGTFWFDYDNDGYQDIYLANHQFISSRPNMLYKNEGGTSFEVVSAGTEIESLFASFGSATADINNDGFLDIFVANWGTTAKNKLFVNENEENNAVLIKAVGTESNRSAIGATVTVRSGALIQMDQVNGAIGYASQSSLVLHFGLADHEIIDELTIHWPSGLIETYENLSVNQYYTLTEAEGIRQDDFSSFDVLNTPKENLEMNTAFPNPFSTYTFIPSGRQAGDNYHVDIFTIEGKQVKTLHNPVVQQGIHGFIWDGSDNQESNVTEGLYFYRLHHAVSGEISTGRLLLQR